MATNDTLVKQDKRPPRLFAYSFGLVFQRSVRRILSAFGWRIRTGLPFRKSDVVAVWGRKESAKRGTWVAKRFNADVLTIEDSFLRSIKTGRQGEASLGLVLDRSGIYFDTSQKSDLHKLINGSPKAPAAELKSAKVGIEHLQRWRLSKYNAHPLNCDGLPENFVLVIDQTLNDASIRLGGAGRETFEEMLKAALLENPNVPILLKTHPETHAGKRLGHFSSELEVGRLQFLDQPVSPWTLFEKADAVYCVTSQMGLEAIFAGHRPIVFGRPFYAGWGLTDDRHPETVQHGIRKPHQLFWAAYLRYSLWYDPFFKRPGDFFGTARTLAARAWVWRFGQDQIIGVGMRLWKRGFLKQFFKQSPSGLRFAKDDGAAVAAAKLNGGKIIVWANQETDYLTDACAQENIPLYRVEDGFLRSAGLGASLVRPVSLAFDDLGIYYDPTRESRLERLIAETVELPDYALERAEALRERLVEARLSKYNLTGRSLTLSPRDKQEVILIPGQVEDDASILKGASEVTSNMGLIWAVRQTFPKAYLVYKPHPDVEAGLRKGAVDADVVNGVVDKVASKADIIDLIDQCDKVATMTSLTGFEALLRGKEVICFGQPFYSGWGLTQDIGGAPSRRKGIEVELDGLVHAALIDYPRYWDPVSGGACAPEVVLDRFEAGQLGRRYSPITRPLAKVQGMFATFSDLWR